MRNRTHFNLPSDTLLPLTKENKEFFTNILNTLNRYQMQEVVMAMLQDPANEIDLDNFSHYFCLTRRKRCGVYKNRVSG